MTTLLASNLKKLGYTVLTYTHVFTSNGVITECKVSKSIGKEGFAGLGQGSNIIESTEMTSKLVYDQINVPEEKSCVLIFSNYECDTDEILELCNLYGEVVRWEVDSKKGQMLVSMKDVEEAEYLVGNHKGFDVKFKDDRHQARNATLIFDDVTSDKIAKNIASICEGYGKFVSTRFCRHMQDSMYVIMKDREVAQRIADDHNGNGFSVYLEDKSCVLIFEMKENKSVDIITLCNKYEDIITLCNKYGGIIKYGGMSDYKLENTMMYVTMKDIKQAELLVNRAHQYFTVRFKDYLDEPLLPPRKDDLEEYMKDREEENQEFEDYKKYQDAMYL